MKRFVTSFVAQDVTCLLGAQAPTYPLHPPVLLLLLLPSAQRAWDALPWSQRLRLCQELVSAAWSTSQQPQSQVRPVWCPVYRRCAYTVFADA